MFHPLDEALSSLDLDSSDNSPLIQEDVDDDGESESCQVPSTIKKGLILVLGALLILTAIAIAIIYGHKPAYIKGIFTDN